MASVSISTALSLCSLFHLTRKPYLSPSPLSFSYISKPHKRKERTQFRLYAMASSDSKESAANNPGLHTTPDEATKGYFMQQTCSEIVSDPLAESSTTEPNSVCSIQLLKRVDVPELKFSLYFLGYEDVSKAPSDPVDRTAWTFGKPATIELTHNWGTESDPEFKGYHNGNSEPRGFGHIGITVDDAIKACERFERLGVEFVKKLDAGKMRGIAFIKDPDDFRKRGWHMKVYLNVLVSEYALP
ncbi:hypothetical protein V6N13_030887 [Hibiscus sabdariffa]